MRTYQIEAARATLGEVVDRARLAGEHALIVRYRKPAAVLVSVGWYQRAAAALGETPDVPELSQGGNDQQ